MASQQNSMIRQKAIVALRSAITRALTTEPLGLSIEPGPDFTAKTDGRASRVLPPFYERVDVGVFIIADIDFSNEVVTSKINLTRNIRISRQLSSDSRVWAEPSEEQVRMYDEALSEAVAKELSKICNPERHNEGGLYFVCVQTN